MLIGLLVFAGLSLLILAHEAGHFFAAKFFKLKVDEFGFGFPPRMFSWKRGETLYSLNWLPFGGFVRIAGEQDGIENDPSIPRDRLFNTQPLWKRLIVIVAGVLINFIAGWLIISGVFMAGMPTAVVINEVRPGSPAYEAGFQSGDIVKGFESSASFSNYIADNKGRSVPFSVLREGKEFTLTATIRTESSPDQGLLGVVFSGTDVRPMPFFAALGQGFRSSIDIVTQTVKGLGALLATIVTKGSLPGDIVGPVGIFSVAQQASTIGLSFVFQIIAIISINLAVLNVMPFPALDGGRMALILLEAVRRKPLSLRAETMINVAGFALLILLMAVITIRDIIRL